MAKVLIVEDEDHIRRLIQLVIEKSGHEAIVAESGERALECVEEGVRPKLILLDIMMPGIDGLQVLQRLRSHHDFKETPIVMLTALAQENVVLQGIKLGANDYIRKPFHPKDLMARIGSFLEQETELE